MKKGKKMLEDYAPKVMTIEQYMLNYTYDIDNIGTVSKEDGQTIEEQFRESIIENHLNEMTHDDFAIWIRIVKERIIREMNIHMTVEFLEALKELEKIYGELFAGKENNASHQYEYRKLKNKIILGDKYRNLIVRLERMKVFSRNDLVKDMLFYGDVVLVKDCTGREKFYQNPYCYDLDDKYYMNALGENIFDTVVSYSDFQVIEEETKEKQKER